MPSTKQYKTPGVYVAELSSFPPSVVGVETAVPAFIGYTEKAEVNGKPVLLKPVAITSLAAFEQVFGGAYKAPYVIESVIPTAAAPHYDFRVWNPTAAPPQYEHYLLKSEHSFNLYNSMRLFYANGGGNCFVVSVALYETTTIAAAEREQGDEAVITKRAVTTVAKVSEGDLTKGLAAAQDQVGPTMLVVPDAVLLPPTVAKQPTISGEFNTVVSEMLTQCERIQDRVAILDVYGTQYLGRTPVGDQQIPDLAKLVSDFRTGVGSRGLSYGMAYFPFLASTVVPLAGMDYTSISNTTLLEKILESENQNLYGDPGAEVVPPNTRAKQVREDIKKIHTVTAPDSTPATIRKLNDDLTAALPLLVEIERQVVAKESVLPPSAAMAGIMAYVDSTRGVWNAPANYSLSAVAGTTYSLNNEQQGDLNLPVDGKAIDALREFPGRGTVVWGARTLDGNSNDFRYIQVRRTMIYVEQSIKLALDPFVFAPNNGQTWTTAVSMVSSFLQTLWSRGGLMGATPSEAFSVECGLGSTMTAQDVLDGYMIVQVVLQLIRPAEFIELTFKQQMAAG